jgi:hypothetical protein
MGGIREVSVRLHTFIVQSLRSFGSRIPFIRSLAMSSKLWHAKNTAVNRRSASPTRKAGQCELPLSWTDLDAEDPVNVLASEKSWFRAADLLELVRLVEGLRR